MDTHGMRRPDSERPSQMDDLYGARSIQSAGDHQPHELQLMAAWEKPRLVPLAPAVDASNSVVNNGATDGPDGYQNS